MGRAPVTVRIGSRFSPSQLRLHDEPDHLGLRVVRVVCVGNRLGVDLSLGSPLLERRDLHGLQLRVQSLLGFVVRSPGPIDDKRDHGLLDVVRVIRVVELGKEVQQSQPNRPRAKARLL